MRKVSTALRSLAFASLAVTAVPAMAQVAISNGPFQTHANGGPSNAPRSVLQTSSPLFLDIFGYGAQVNASNRVADNFTIPASQKLKVSGVAAFTYQTGVTSVSVNDMRLRILNGAPNAGGTSVFGDLATNRLAAATSTGVYRVDDVTTPVPSNRLIQRARATVSPVTTLGPGTFWAEYQLGGTGASGPWAVPVTVLGQGGKAGANALQYSGIDSLYSACVDGSPTSFAQDMAFEVLGIWVSEPTAFNTVTGLPFGGAVADLVASDDNKVFTLMDENDPNGNVEFIAATASPSAASISFTYEGAATRNDLSLFLDLQNNTNGWETVDTSTTGFSDVTRVATISTNAGRFIRAAGELKARARWIPQQDLEAADGWATEVDFVGWEITPL